MELHHRLGPKLKSKAAKIGAGFVDTCLEYLGASVSRISDLRSSSPSKAGKGEVVEGGGRASAAAVDEVTVKPEGGRDGGSRLGR